MFESEALSKTGLSIVQSSISRTSFKGTLRGLHSLSPACREWKLVTCVSGSVWDVVVNVDAQSDSFGTYEAATLNGNNADWALIPPGFAHGFLSLTDDVILSYSMTAEYDVSRETGYRFDDPVFGIQWPFEPTTISDKDRSFPLLSRAD